LKYVVLLINTKEKVYNILEALKGAVEIKDRTSLLTKYPSSFVGSKAVDWFVKQFHFSRRQQAVKLGELLIEVKGIQGLNHQRFLDDSQSLYRVIAHKKNELSLHESRY
jgi:hypothetical protein